MLTTMAEVRVAPAEESRVALVAAEMDAEFAAFFSDVKELLSPASWDLLHEYARACILRALELGVLLHAVVDAHGSRGVPYKGGGRDAFVRRGVAAWRESFAPVRDVWRLAAVFSAVPGGERRVMGDVETLEVMATNRMFVSLEQQCSELLGTSRDRASD